jgi:hypothetical protein
MTGVSDAADAAREAAGKSIDPAVHRYNLALQAAVTAAERDLDRRLHPPAEPNMDGIPPWSEVSREGESEGPLPF